MKKNLFWVLLTLLFSFVTPQPVLGVDDLRVLQLETVLMAYHSPMLPYASELITLAEKYKLDWTLLAAIAGTESSFGKRMPESCLNPYGWGIYGSNRLCFATFPEAAEAVAKGLSTRYNTTSLESIARTYNKVSTEGWLNHTRFFVNKIKNQSIPVAQLPIEL